MKMPLLAQICHIPRVKLFKNKGFNVKRQCRIVDNTLLRQCTIQT